MSSIRPQPRDSRLLRDIFLHRVATRDQLIALGHFASIPRCNYRLEQLVRSRLLRRVRSVNGISIHQGLYAPGPAAIPFLVRSSDAPYDEIVRRCSGRETPQLIEHSLGTLNFRVELIESPGLRLREWMCESECLHHFRHRTSDGQWSSVVVKPDAYCRLSLAGATFDCFVEIDLGHVSLPRFQAKLDRYELYSASGAFSDVYRSKDFQVLTVTTGERRLVHLAKLQTRISHLVTTFDRVSCPGIAGCEWVFHGRSARLAEMIVRREAT